jgi:phosphoglycolate phosphatase-like HAD superfamily hydrolase
MKLAFEQLYGIEDGFARVEFSGRTDQHILRSALEHHDLLPGNDAFADEMARFQQVYYGLLPRTLAEAEGRALPGVPELLAALSGRDGVRAGLATGNFREAAFMKLDYFGLGGLLREGGFGEDAEDRSAMVAVAIERLANGARDVWVIGDTLLDLEAARANNARSLGVATGPLSVAELLDAGADLAFEDLSDTAAVLSALLDRIHATR